MAELYMHLILYSDAIYVIDEHWQDQDKCLMLYLDVLNYDELCLDTNVIKGGDVV